MLCWTDINWIYFEDGPFDWKKHNLIVLADHHDENGERYHLVEPNGVVKTGDIIANANIYVKE